MVSWETRLVDSVRSALQGNPAWEDLLVPGPCLHLAVLAQPYLSLVIEGRKLIETRFSVKRCPPYECVDRGDLVLLKGIGGPVTGICRVLRVEYYEVTQDRVDMLRSEYSKLICADDRFWETRASFRYASLLWISEVTWLCPITCRKRDRRGWVPLGSYAASP
jgi:hypothetical protein